MKQYEKYGLNFFFSVEFPDQILGTNRLSYWATSKIKGSLLRLRAVANNLLG